MVMNFERYISDPYSKQDMSDYVLLQSSYIITSFS